MTIEELTEQLTTLQQQFSTLQNEKTEQDTMLEQLQKANKDLMNTNHKLFLSVTGDNNSDDDKTNGEQEYIDHVGDKLWQVLSKSEKEKLKSILEGDDE